MAEIGDDIAAQVTTSTKGSSGVPVGSCGLWLEGTVGRIASPLCNGKQEALSVFVNTSYSITQCL